MIQYKNILEIKDNRHSCAKLKTYHFSGEEHYKVGFINYKKNQYETRVLKCKDEKDLIRQVNELEKYGIVYDNAFIAPYIVEE